MDLVLLALGITYVGHKIVSGISGRRGYHTPGWTYSSRQSWDEMSDDERAWADYKERQESYEIRRDLEIFGSDEYN